jgi:hypothetical protein
MPGGRLAPFGPARGVQHQHIRHQAFVSPSDSLTGFVSRPSQVLRAAVTRLKMKISDAELQSMIDDADRSGQGEVGLEEYVHILKNSTWV